MKKCTSATMSGRGQRGTTTLRVCQDTGRRTNKKLSESKEQKKWTGWKPKNDEQKKRIQEVMEKDDDKFDEDLATFSENY